VQGQGDQLVQLVDATRRVDPQPHHIARGLLFDPIRHRRREPGFANTGRTRDAHQSVLLPQRPEPFNLVVAADQRGQGSGGVGVDGARRGGVGLVVAGLLSEPFGEQSGFEVDPMLDE